ncbi:MAG: cyanophycinase [Bryobacteraceae bacterium]
MRLLTLALFACSWTFAASIGPSKGSLVIVGGGKVGPEIVARFVSLAGGSDANFVVIPSAGEDRQINSEVEKKFGERFGVKHVTVLHTRDRGIADSATFVAPLLEASGVWFEGGRQWRLVDSYLGTRTEREIKAVLDRGGVIGGSSAGATIQGSYLVRGATEGNTVMMAKSHEQGFGLIKNVAIDQHIITRHREKDLGAVIEAHPELLGIGIDESTAIVVQGDRFQVIGQSKVAITDGKDHEGKKYFFLSSGDRYDLAHHQVVSP